MHYALEPEGCFNFDGGPEMDPGGRRRVVWSSVPGDCLTELARQYIIERRAGLALIAAEATGFAIHAVDNIKDAQTTFLFPDVNIPPFDRLEITGTAYQDDAGMDERDKYKRLVVSERMLSILRLHSLGNCTVEPMVKK